MQHARTSAMDTQRFDPTIRRTQSSLTVATDGHEDESVSTTVAGTVYLVVPATRRRTSGPASRASHIGARQSKDLEIARIQVEASSEGCSTATNAEDFSVHEKHSEAHGHKGKVRDYKIFGTRVLYSLDCRRDDATSEALFDDTSSDVVKVTSYKPSQNAETLYTQVNTNPTYTAFATSKNTVQFTNEYQHEDGYTATRDIIRSRTRSNQAALKVQKKEHGCFIHRIRSLDCMRDGSAFENNVDVIQTQTFGSLLPDLKVAVVEENSKKRDFLRPSTADKINQRQSIVSYVEATHRR